MQQRRGTAQITYLDSNGQSFTVRHSKIAALRQGMRFARNAGCFLARYATLKRVWRQGYEELATTRFWEARLKLVPQDPDRG